MTSNPCFLPDELQQFILGELPDDQSQRIESHLAECPVCEDTVSSLDEAADTLVRHLRSSKRESQYDQDGDYQQALQRVQTLALPSEPIGSERDGNDSSPSVGEAWLRDYRLLAPLGRGGMGTVYRALHTRLDMPVAIKLLPDRRLRDSEAVARFQREMRAIGQLNHPAIVRATDAGQIGDTHFLVMELVHGLDLGKLVRAGGKLTVADACEIVRQAACGIQYAHEHGIVHRDLKPSNLMLTSAGQVKILDMGLARLSGLQGVDELTTVGQLMGTLDYMAPEQCDDSHEVDHHADVYGLGATLYKLLCGESPYAGPNLRTPLQKLKALATMPVFPIAQRGIEVPQALSDVLDRALARQPVDRFESAVELAESLEAFVDGHDLAAVCGIAQAIAAEENNEPGGLDLPSQMAESALAMQLAPLPTDGTRPSAGLGPRPQAGGPRRPIRALVGLMGAAAFFFAAILIYLETGKGRLTIECSRENVQVRILRSGQVYDQLQLHQGPNSTRIGAGQYDVELIGDADQLLIEKGSFTLKRGEDWIARVVHEEGSGGGQDTTVSPLRPKPTATAASEPKYDDWGHKLAAAASEPKYDGRRYDEWAHELRTERSPERRDQAILALIALGKEHRSRETAELILETTRLDDLINRSAANASLASLTIRALGRVKQDELPELLRAALDKGTSGKRYIALGYVTSQGLELDFVESVLQASRDPNANVRRRAVDGLLDDTQPKRITPEAKVRLREMLSDLDPHVACEAASALVQIDHQCEQLVPVLVRLAEREGEGHVPRTALGQLLLLAPQRADEVLPEIIRLIRLDIEPDSRTKLARAIAQLSGQLPHSALPDLIQLVQLELEPTTQAMLAFALVRLASDHPDDLLPVLIRFVESDQSWLRETGKTLLARDEYTQFLQLFRANTVDDSNAKLPYSRMNKTLQDAAIFTLGQMGPAAQASVPALQTELQRRVQARMRSLHPSYVQRLGGDRQRLERFHEPLFPGSNLVADALEKITGNRPEMNIPGAEKPETTAAENHGSDDPTRQPPSGEPTRQDAVYEGATLRQWVAGALAGPDNVDQAVRAITALHNGTPKKSVDEELEKLHHLVQKERSPDRLSNLVQLLCALASDQSARDVTLATLQTIRRLPRGGVYRGAPRDQRGLAAAASSGLSELPKEIVVPILIEELDNGNESGRLFALRVLEMYGISNELSAEQSKAVTSAFVQASREATGPVRLIALNAAVDFAPNSEAVRQRLREAINEEDPATALVAAEWMGRFHPSNANWLAVAKRHVVSPDFTIALSASQLLLAAASADDAAVLALAELLDDPSFGDQIGRASNPLTGNAENLSVRGYIILGLAKIGKRGLKAVPALLRQATESKNATIRQFAAVAYQKIKRSPVHQISDDQSSELEAVEEPKKDAQP